MPMPSSPPKKKQVGSHQRLVAFFLLFFLQNCQIEEFSNSQLSCHLKRFKDTSNCVIITSNNCHLKDQSETII